MVEQNFRFAAPLADRFYVWSTGGWWRSSAPPNLTPKTRDAARTARCMTSARVVLHGGMNMIARNVMVLGLAQRLCATSRRSGCAAAGRRIQVVIGDHRRHVRRLCRRRSAQGGVEAIKMAIADFGGTVLGKQIERAHRRPPEQARHRCLEVARVGRPGRARPADRRHQHGVSIAMAKVAAEKKVPFIAIGAGAASLTNEDCTRLHDPLRLRHDGARQRHRDDDRQAAAARAGSS